MFRRFKCFLVCGMSSFKLISLVSTLVLMLAIMHATYMGKEVTYSVEKFRKKTLPCVWLARIL